MMSCVLSRVLNTDFTPVSIGVKIFIAPVDIT